jgi:thiol:disulfide interchange protein/DsbC/DsbD-like thiol-disulfide interchange protein
MYQTRRPRECEGTASSQKFFASFFQKRSACLLGLAMRWLPLLLMLFSLPAMALESAPVTTRRTTATLVSDVDSFAPGKKFHLGLRLKMAPGWHSYWSNPGDAGAPPALEVSGATAGAIEFPAPLVLHDGPFTSFAYTGEVLFPVTATMAVPGRVSVQANWLVCETVCVPEEAKFSLDLPEGDARPSAQSPLFAEAAAHTPRPSPFAAHVTRDGVLWLAAPNLAVREALFFPANAGVIDHGAAQVLSLSADRVALALKPLKRPVGAISGMLRLVDAGGQVENLTVTATSAELPVSKTSATTGPRLLEALLLAFAGGLILNLMPCVLPVLAMKALALARLSGAARGHVRREAGFYTLGVLVAFGLIGGITLAARAAGGAAGWGVQFQSAIFTTATGWLLFLIGLNMSGVFQVGAGLAGAGQGLASRGSFFTGLLAVVVATPCTAPFMGAALAAAFAMPAAMGMLIFLALGLGLAAPYAALALSPGVARLLPRPGAWMDVLKHGLAFPMYGAALWMVWVASQQTDQPGLAVVFASFLALAFAAWAYGYAQARDGGRWLRGAAVAGLVCAVALLAMIGWAAPPVGSAHAASTDGSEPFSATRLATLRAAHRPVLVDMSAAWCVTCLVNERLALQPTAVRTAFAAHNLAYLKGDWTRRDAAITAYLQQFDRSGVPLYVFYPASGEPEVLPQILTEGLILDRLAGSK